MLIPFRPEEIEGNIGRRFHEVARRIPGNPAIRTPEAAISFAELDAASDRLSRLLLRRRGAGEEPVALLLEEGIEGWAALLGILKAGKSVVLLPPDFEIPRLTAIWKDAGQPPILTNRDNRPLAELFSASPESIIPAEESAPDSADLPVPRTGPDSLAVISYTSGSTGEPKGVMWPHRFVLHTARYNSERYNLSGADRFTFLSVYGFSAAMIQSFAALLNGATLYLGSGRFHDLRLLIDWLYREGMTVLHLTSFALFRQQTAIVKEKVRLPALRVVLLSGEELYRRDLEMFRAFFPDGMKYSYRFAGSEALMMTELALPPDYKFHGDKVPVGSAVPDKQLLLLDADRRPVPPGETGEIAIRSRYLAAGYWRKEELTRAKFLPDPEGGTRRIFLSGDMGRLLPDGGVLYEGRKDNIVRVRGFNIQLEAVETALEQVPGVREAAVVAPSIRGGDKRLAAYLAVNSGAKLPISKIRNHLIALLPAYMIPTVYVFLDFLPRTPMGRLDRQALPPPGTDRPDLDAPLVEPRDDLERRVCVLWAEIIRLDQVGIDDDFFLLGGDSLLAMHMVLRAEEEMHRRIPTAFFRKPTIRHLTELWSGGEDSKAAPVAAADGPASGDQSPMKRKGGNRNRSGARSRFRKRYKSRTTIVGPRSIRLAKRLPRLAVELATLQLPYSQGIRWISRWCGNPLILRTFYPAESGLFRRWMADLGGCPEVPADALNACVLSNILWSTRFKRTIRYMEDETFLDSMRRSSARFHRDLARIIAESPVERLERFFHAEGLELVQEVLRQGRGVILVSYHGAVNRFASAVLPLQLGQKTIPTLSLSHGMKLKRRESSGARPAVNEPAIMANVAVEGLRILKQGGIVQVIPDIGYDAAEGVTLDIGRYRFLIRPGFAEMALAADAAVIPWFSTRRISGRIDMRFHPPLDPGSPSENPAARIGGMLRLYGAFVENAWSLAPESLLWEVIDTHMNRPLAEG